MIGDMVPCSGDGSSATDSIEGGRIAPSLALLDVATLRVAACFLGPIDHWRCFLMKVLNLLGERSGV